MSDVRHDPLGALPAGLPPGRPVVPALDGPAEGPPVMWVSDEALPDAARHWLRLYEIREKTRLYPLLLDTLDGDPARPWHDGELGDPAPVGAIDVLTAEGVLRRFWESVTEELPEDAGAEDRFDDAGVPRGPWPGLAPAGLPDRDPDAMAREYVEAAYVGKPMLLGLVPAARGADTLALGGWDGPCNHTDDIQELSAVLRSWEDRFGARLIAVGFATLDLSVAAPPITTDHAIEVAVEHHAFCPDNVWQGTGDLYAYAERLVGVGNWSFWWD